MNNVTRMRRRGWHHSFIPSCSTFCLAFCQLFKEVSSTTRFSWLLWRLQHWWCVEHKSFPVEKVKKAHMLSWHTCWGVSWIPIESVHRRRCLVRSSLEFTHGIRDTQSHSWLKSCQRTIERLCGSHACSLEMMMMAMIIMIITKIAVTPSLLFESKEAYMSCHQTSS